MCVKGGHGTRTIFPPPLPPAAAMGTGGLDLRRHCQKARTQTVGFAHRGRRRSCSSRRGGCHRCVRQRYGGRGRGGRRRCNVRYACCCCYRHGGYGRRGLRHCGRPTRWARAPARWLRQSPTWTAQLPRGTRTSPPSARAQRQARAHAEGRQPPSLVSRARKVCLVCVLLVAAAHATRRPTDWRDVRATAAGRAGENGVCGPRAGVRPWKSVAVAPSLHTLAQRPSHTTYILHAYMHTVTLCTWPPGGGGGRRRTGRRQAQRRARPARHRADPLARPPPLCGRPASHSQPPVVQQRSVVSVSVVCTP
jgi:hypothetical protein